MARYPTYEEYQDKPAKGVQRCDELLKKDPSNVTILLTKLQLQTTLIDIKGAEQTLSRLCSSRPPITDLSEISTIEEAVVELQNQSYPLPLSAGSDVAKLWDGSYKASSNLKHKLDLQSLRFSRAIIDNRLSDAQQPLIQLKGLLPKNRVFYMAHTALTQMLSTSKDDLQSRLAMGLARKAVSEKFDDEKDLDCRVPGQIFAIQASTKDIESIAGRRFADSKQICDARRSGRQRDSEHKLPASIDPTNVPPREWFLAELVVLRAHFKTMIGGQCSEEQLRAFAGNSVRLFRTATKSLSLQSFRPISEAVFLSVSALVKAWSITQTPTYLLQSIFLAEALLRLQPKVHEAKVILVYLYMRLGLGRPAYLEWDSLATKEVQYDTFGHVFLSQVSITHPHYLTDIDPLRIVVHGLGAYRRCEDKLAETHASVLNHGQTGMLFDLFELRECLRLSATRRILSLEHRRLARLNNKALNEHSIFVHPRLTAAWLDIKDNRDFSAAFNYGFDVERALHGPDEVKNWILFGLAADSLWCLAGNSLPLISDTAALLTQLQSLPDRDSTPHYEWVVGELVTSLLELAFSIDTPANVANIKVTVVDALSTMQIDELIKEDDLLPLRVRCIYLYLDSLLLVGAFCRYAESKKAISREDVSQIRGTASTYLKQLQAYCKARIAGVSAAAIKSSMSAGVDDDFSKEIQSLDSEEMGKFYTAVAEASRDAWGGAIHYRV